MSILKFQYKYHLTEDGKGTFRPTVDCVIGGLIFSIEAIIDTGSPTSVFHSSILLHLPKHDDKNPDVKTKYLKGIGSKDGKIPATEHTETIKFLRKKEYGRIELKDATLFFSKDISPDIAIIGTDLIPQIGDYIEYGSDNSKDRKFILSNNYYVRSLIKLIDKFAS